MVLLEEADKSTTTSLATVLLKTSSLFNGEGRKLNEFDERTMMQILNGIYAEDTEGEYTVTCVQQCKLTV
jgi:hypothetical protein